MKKFLSLAGGLLLASGAMAQTEAPEALYLVGTFNNWTVPAEGGLGLGYALTDEDKDGVYTGEFKFDTEELSFKVFDSANATWEDRSHYFGAYLLSYKVFNDQPAKVSLGNNNAGEFNVNVTNWEAGGTLKFEGTIERNESDEITGVSLTLSSDTQPAYTDEREPATALWIVGDVEGWNVNFSDLKLEMVEDQVFEGTFDFPHTYNFNNFRFYTELGNWEFGSVGSGMTDEEAQLQVLDLKEGEPVTVPCDYGNGNWYLPSDWTDAPIKIRVDLNTMEVTFERQATQTDVPVVPDGPEALYLVGTFNNWTVPADGGLGLGYALTDDDKDGVYTGEFKFDTESVEFKVFDSADASWEDSSNYYGCYLLSYKVFYDQPEKVFLATNYNSGEFNLNVTNWVAGGTLKFEAEIIREETGEIRGIALTLSSDTQPAYSDVREPATALWIIGDVEGWNVNFSDLKFEMVEDQVFEGTFDFPHTYNFNNFRFYTELGNWEYGSVGSGMTDEEAQLQVLDLKEGEPLTVPCDYGQGNWYLPSDWTDAPIKIRVDLNKMEVTFERQAPKEEEELSCIYLIGTLQDWSINSDALQLQRVEKNVFAGQFEVESGSVFRFYTELGNWETGSIGSQVEDSPIELDPAVAEMLNPVVVDCVWGKGSWRITEWPGGKLSMNVDLNDMKVTFTRDDGSAVEGIEYVNDEAPVYYNLLGAPVSNPGKGIYIRVANGKSEKVVL